MKFKKLLIGLACVSFSVSAFAAKNFKANVLYDQKHPFTHYGYLTWADYLKDISGGELNPKVYTGTVLLAAMLLGETLSIAQWGGGVLILGGVLWLSARGGASGA